MYSILRYIELFILCTILHICKGDGPRARVEPEPGAEAEPRASTGDLKFTLNDIKPINEDGFLEDRVVNVEA